MSDQFSDAEILAMRFHEHYEALAAKFGYQTRVESRKPWLQVPEQNRNLMIATCARIIDDFHLLISNDPISEEGITHFSVTSGFGHNTQRPFVQMVIPRADWMTQMSPGDARDLALNLLACADAAESDGFLVTFLRKTIGVDDMRAVASILVEFRQHRDQNRKVE